MLARNGTGPNLCGDRGGTGKTFGTGKSESLKAKKSKTQAGHIFGRHDLTWRGHVLQVGRWKLAKIKVDTVWPGMWRVYTPDRPITDMVNLTRGARDAALALALGMLNRKRNEETGPEAPFGAALDIISKDGRP